MTVKELIKQLQTLPPDADIYVWNGDYAEWEEIEEGAYQPDEEFFKVGDGGIVIS